MTSERVTRRRWSWSGLLLAGLAAALWGLAPVATKGALQGFSPEFISCFRLTVAAVLFRALAGQGARWFVADAWIWLAGVALGTDFILYNYGLQRTSANVAGVVINIELVSTIAFAVWLLGERLDRRRVLGSAVTVTGVLVVTGQGIRFADMTAATQAVGNLMVMAAGVAWSLFAVAQRRAHCSGNLFHRLAPIFSVAALTTAAPLLHRGAWTMAPSMGPAVMLAVLTVLCTGLVYLVYARAQQLVDVSVLAIWLSSIPVFAVVFAYVLLGEPLTQRLLIGGTLAVAGILIIALEKHVMPELSGVDASPAAADAAGGPVRPPVAGRNLGGVDSACNP